MLIFIGLAVVWWNTGFWTALGIFMIVTGLVGAINEELEKKANK